MIEARAKTIEASPAAIADAAHRLRAGGLVAFPTETVYGLGADATDGEAVAAIFAAKGRPRFNPLIVHVEDLEQAERLARLPDAARRLARAFWPGALTLVAPRKADCAVSLLASAGLDTLALRAPSHAVARALLKETGRPLAAPSANASGRVSPTTAAHVADELGDRIDLILDGGTAMLGIESTVIGFVDGRATLLRPGAVLRDDIEALVGPLAAPAAAILAPGQLESHYAPRARLRLNAKDAGNGEVLLGFGPEAPSKVTNLSAGGDLKEAAANLFAMLRALDASGAKAIAVMPVPDTGLGEAINDRLRRAAAPRRA
ncbi:MAG: threonylcarbamoyl-AMP synthase [Alphaproteobacteria bacterium]|nr:threonylcarbamoyl-AMP synthase [Alphaproteobacteria bacterium]MBV9693242.1 threonylcarbamoyl-AMP synthase [Alphaproteobacteria bacterium]